MKHYVYDAFGETGSNPGFGRCQVGMTNRDNEDLTWLRETSPTTNREDVVNSSVDLMMVSDSFSVLLNRQCHYVCDGIWQMAIGDDEQISRLPLHGSTRSACVQCKSEWNRYFLQGWLTLMEVKT